MDLKQFVERYGIALGVVVALVAVIAILPGNASQRADSATDFDLSAGGDAAAAGADIGGTGATTGTGAGTTPTGSDGGTVSTSGGGGGAGATGGGGGGGGGGGEAQSQGGVAFGSGPNCDENGRQEGIATTYMPPCASWEPGTDNGGATFRGVEADKVTVVRWLGQLDPATAAILQGAQLSDSPEQIERTYEAERKYHNQHYETYGREVVFVNMQASGPSESDEAMKADALKIAEEIKPFAVIEGNPAAGVPITLARELVQRGILCMCTTSASSAFYTELPPLLFSSLPTADEYAEFTAEYIAKKMWGKPAEHAGDDQLPTQTFRDDTRKFGLIYIEGARGRVEPEAQRAKDAMLRAFEKYGMSFAQTAGYIYDPGRNQADVTNLIAGMRNEGITTIVPLWDPLYPILITQEATRQQYYPEWFIAGVGLSDTTSAGRLYDQAQWNNAFGISPLWVTWTAPEKSTAYREYKHADPNTEPGVLVSIYRARIQTLFRGIHMAGPNLSNETFVRGMLAYPPSGGQPRSPLVFYTRELPTEIKDFTEVFYDQNAQGNDERGNSGRGMVMKAQGGKRYRLGEFDQAPPRAFQPDGAIAV
ncbi:MAG TPA: hypothetical protein VEA78_02870, partial [Acidimicrobiales bacterium]|nr:hypothetical protein [Acidimicrobiales bacterium]